MTTIYDVPQELNPYHLNRLQGREGLAAEEEWLKMLAAQLRKRASGELVGEVIRERVADGFASYMVAKEAPLELVHLPLGDCYEFSWAHRWTLEDVKLLVEQERAINELFA